MKTPFFPIPPIRCNHHLIVVFALLILSMASSHTVQAEATRVAIIPLKIDADSDLSFLRDGIQSMLVSRLSWNGRITVLATAEAAAVAGTGDRLLDETGARDLGARLGADYTVFGSLTVSGDDMCIDITVVAVNGKRPAQTFSRQSRQMDDAIPQINLLAEEINKRVFGREPTGGSAATIAPAQRPSIYAHPERLLSSEPATPGPAPEDPEEKVKTGTPPPGKPPGVEQKR